MPAAPATAAPPALRAFLNGLFDYAGLFPPAKLPLEAAGEDYARYRSGADAWMLGRFICPAHLLDDLAAHPSVREAGPYPVAVLGSAADSAAALAPAVEADAYTAARYAESVSDRVHPELYETRVPAAPPAEVGRAVREASEAAGALPAFFEVTAPGANPGAVGAALDALAAASGGAVRGFKLRCGGVTPDAFPAPETVARVIAAARDARVPLKCTAGLHHPTRYHDAELGVDRFGFLGVFGAAVLAWTAGLDERAIREVLEERDLGAFRADDRFGWREVTVPAAAVAEARAAFATSFGTCSFDEPRDHLRAAGWPL